MDLESCLVSLTSDVEPKLVSAVITGPHEASVSEPVILDASSSTADIVRWVYPKELKPDIDKCGTRLLFVPQEQGKVTFSLVAIKFVPTIEVSLATHDIVVGSPGGEIPAPVPVPGLVSFVAETTAELNDEPTVKSLINHLEKAVAHIKTSNNLDVAKAVLRLAVEVALSERKGDSTRVDWLNGWRRPVDAKIQEINPGNVVSYASCIEQVITGLRSTISV